MSLTEFGQAKLKAPPHSVKKHILFGGYNTKAVSFMTLTCFLWKTWKKLAYIQTNSSIIN